MGRYTQAELLAHFEAADVTVGQVADMTQIVDDPMVKAREVITCYEDDEMDYLPMHNLPAALSETPGRIRRPAPKLGQHNEEIYGEVGVDAEALERLEREGVI
jgi:crotonobetainyl-CoA:carnitine CoA-transferase CaiB-like acyl-CoA transferase